MPEPDFDQIARAVANDGDEGQASRIIEQLRQVWNAGKEAGARHETFVQHVKDENTAAHRALDRLHAPTTKRAPTRDGTGEQDITIGLAERIDAARRQVWNARGAALVDPVTNAVDEWVRAGAGTYDELQEVVDRAIKTLDR